MKITLSRIPLPRRKDSDWLVFLLGGKPLLTARRDALLRRLLRMLDTLNEPAADFGHVSVLPTWDTLPARHVIVAGLGRKAEFHRGRLVQATSAAVRAAGRREIHRLATPMVTELAGLSAADFAKDVALGAHAGAYRFRRFTSPSVASAGTAVSLQMTDIPAESAPRVRRALREGDDMGEVLSTVRDLANLPGNEAGPGVIASTARRLSRTYGLSCSVLDMKQLRQKKCHALLSVAQGSGGDARLITMRHQGGRTGQRPIVLIGKTITFDTGGISLKPARNMQWMKFDKCGGMAVLAAMLIAARLKLKQTVIGMLPTAENMPGGKATRPGDIVRSLSGKTIEILNTDAEGRLVLADALTMAGTYKPRAIVDVATLTGAAVVALGHVAAPVMGNDNDLVNALHDAGAASGERVWQLPLHPEYSHALKSHFADLRNIGDGSAGCIAAGAFLKHFVPENTPWAHIDVAGTSWEERTQPHCDPGVTLFGARLLVEWMRRLET